ncbi:MAG TPA: LON peptidase substrate-binding domain-containing protein [Pyrinomonadaceae bacterium]|nr:LON peptidase substrate-binding domain-containing protein [Pyrinomonadaceae bacterium]
MSDATNKVLGANYLPIFPLPIVLFPNELLPLHIYEPRYRQMLKDIQKGNHLFGLNYFDSQETISETPEIGSVGCVAEVREVHPVPDGRSNILTIGVIRYEIENYVERDKPYLMAEVTFFEDFEEDEDFLKPLADEVFGLFRRIAQAAHELTEQRGKFPEIPQAEPQMLSFLVAAAFNLPVEIKQELVKSRSTSFRLTKLRELLLQAVEQAEASANINKVAKTNGHSNKKIDLDS